MKKTVADGTLCRGTTSIRKINFSIIVFRIVK